MPKIKVGSRDSKLAVIQSELLINEMRKANPHMEFELVTMKTTGDIILDKSLDKIGGKGLFVKELDSALQTGKIDISIHSLKDMPVEEDPSLPIITLSKREDPRDALVLPFDKQDMDIAGPIGCSSLRRQLQLSKLYPQMNFKNVRGNVLTRLAKLDKGEYSALVLASAGLIRLGLKNRISRYFDTTEIIPSAGQGILAVQGRKGEDHSFLECINNMDSQCQAAAEREFIRTLDGGCSSPIAAYAKIDGNEIKLTGFYVNQENGTQIIDTICGKREDARKLGYSLAVSLIKLGTR